MANLFSHLYPLLHRVDENYVTEIFVYILRHLTENCWDTARQFMRYFFSTDNCPFDIGEEKPRIRTQQRGILGQPDVELQWPDACVLVEVKKRSVADAEQLRRYRDILDGKSHPAHRKRLILLTMLPESGFAGAEGLDRHIRWYAVSQWFKEWLQSASPTDDVTRFLVDQFVAFLEEQRMSIKQVTNEYVLGIRMFENLIAMLGQAIRDAGIDIYKDVDVAGKKFSGFHIGKTSGSMFIGISLDALNVVRLELNKAFDWPKLKSIGGWEVPGNKAYKTFAIDEAFFALTAEGQLQVLTTFVTNAYQEAVSCKLTQSSPPSGSPMA